MTTKPLSLFHYLPLCRKRQKHQRSTTACVTITIDNYSLFYHLPLAFHLYYSLSYHLPLSFHLLLHGGHTLLTMDLLRNDITSETGCMVHHHIASTKLLATSSFRYIPAVHHINQRRLLHLLFAKPPYSIIMCTRILSTYSPRHCVHICG